MSRYLSRSLRHLSTWALAAVLALPALAAELATPTGEVVLTITGNVTRTNADGRAEFDQAMLESLELSKLRTWTPWTEGEPEFIGVTAKTLMEHVGARGTVVEAKALNDYEITIPLSDFETYPVLVAMAMNGEPLRVRDKGPLWLIYPWSAYPELDDRVRRQRSIWQLESLHVR